MILLSAVSVSQHSATTRWQCALTVSMYTFFSGKSVCVYDSVNRSLLASAPCRKTVCRGDERSILRNWMNKEMMGERDGQRGEGWVKQYQTDTALQGRKKRVNACVQGIFKRSQPSSKLIHEMKVDRAAKFTFIVIVKVLLNVQKKKKENHTE